MRRATHYAYEKRLYYAACGRILTGGLAGFHGAADYTSNSSEVTCKACLKVIQRQSPIKTGGSN